jgi:hypothetical protein
MFKDRLNPVAVAIIQEDQAKRSVRRMFVGGGYGSISSGDRPIIDLGNLRRRWGNCRLILQDDASPDTGAFPDYNDNYHAQIVFRSSAARRLLSEVEIGRPATVVTKGRYEYSEQTTIGGEPHGPKKIKSTGVTLTMRAEMPPEETSVVFDSKTEPRRRFLGKLHDADFGRIPNRTVVYKSRRRHPAA